MVQWIGLCAFTVKSMGSVPGLGTKIPQAMRQQPKKKKYKSKKSLEESFWSAWVPISGPAKTHFPEGFEAVKQLTAELGLPVSRGAPAAYKRQGAGESEKYKMPFLPSQNTHHSPSRQMSIHVTETCGRNGAEHGSLCLGVGCDRDCAEGRDDEKASKGATA